jgi:predicted nucleic acid-binding Zn ribbon protein
MDAGTALDYVDDEGRLWIMCACGHRVTGLAKMGKRKALCPNCQLLAMCGEKIKIIYPKRLPWYLRWKH